MKRFLIVPMVLWWFAGPSAGAAAETAEPAADAAVRKVGDDYVQAFNKHDPKALAEFYSADAVYTNRLTKELVTGRAAIAAQFTEIFKDEPEVKIEISNQKFDFVSPNVAVENGTAKYTVPKEQPTSIDYSAVYVRHDGKWLLDRVTDKPRATPPSHYEQLKELEWMVGNWLDEDPDVTVHTNCMWSKNRNFLIRLYDLVTEGDESLGGVQIVGWDPSSKSIRSWTFDSDGGFSEGTWSRKGDRWFIRDSGVLGDGRKASAVNIVRKIDGKSFTWQSIDRTAGGDLLPDVDEVREVRR